MLFAEEEKEKVMGSLEDVWILQDLTNSHLKHPIQTHVHSYMLGAPHTPRSMSVRKYVLFYESMEMNKDIYIAQTETT